MLSSCYRKAVPIGASFFPGCPACGFLRFHRAIPLISQESNEVESGESLRVRGDVLLSTTDSRDSSLLKSRAPSPAGVSASKTKHESSVLGETVQGRGIRKCRACRLAKRFHTPAVLARGFTGIRVKPETRSEKFTAFISTERPA
uniref:Uncharacterized protein n=1 Tax=Myotis myotis TaxID=51298 RepID=A0A7J7TJ52_MYOMY|nr:hypothetical protein mMyoMyo1_009028 [Myotis myotis]